MKAKILTICCILFFLASCQEKLSYEGYVKDAQTGKPLEDAEVNIAFLTGKVFTTKTDHNGYYKITFPCADSVLFMCSGSVRHQGFRKVVIINHEERKKNDNKFNIPDILLKFKKNRAYCSGRVVDAQGKPLKDIEVAWITSDGGSATGAITSKEGTYTLVSLTGLRAIRYTFTYKDKFFKDTINIMLDSLGKTVYAPDVVLKKENK